MNRDDLKYRVWSVSDEKYITNVVLIPTGVVLRISENGDGSCELWGGPPIGVERCTGLKDEDGELIYKGDFIRVDDEDSRREVCWFHGEWNVTGERLADLCRTRRVKVVGNIHGVRNE